MSVMKVKLFFNERNNRFLNHKAMKTFILYFIFVFYWITLNTSEKINFPSSLGHRTITENIRTWIHQTCTPLTFEFRWHFQYSIHVLFWTCFQNMPSNKFDFCSRKPGHGFMGPSVPLINSLFQSANPGFP